MCYAADVLILVPAHSKWHQILEGIDYSTDLILNSAPKTAKKRKLPSQKTMEITDS